MRRYFNTEGACNPKKHYMVNLDARLKQIKEQYVDRGSYFVINRGRQYGKTTTLHALREYLRPEYLPVFLDFQGIGTAEFQNERMFARAFSQMFAERFARETVCCAEQVRELADYADDYSEATLRGMFKKISVICGMTDKPIVLLVDEVDSASNNQVFLDFLALLRQYYLAREDYPIFQSVILAGVYDIKNLKSKIRPDEQHKYNSPWNIAADFMVRMSLSESEIAGMLKEYEADNHTGMDEAAVAHEIYAYTSGYPYLVSRICKLLDEVISQAECFEDSIKVWSREGIDEAVKLVLDSKAPLFDSMTRQLYEHPDMKQMLQLILFQGQSISYNSDNAVINLAEMFGYITNVNGIIRITNRIFETRLYNLFISEDVLTNAIYGKAQENISQFINNGKLDMDRVVEK